MLTMGWIDRLLFVRSADLQRSAGHIRDRGLERQTQGLHVLAVVADDGIGARLSGSAYCAGVSSRGSSA